MPLPSPNLDTRTFAQLVQEAQKRIAASCPAWTDTSPGDPGMTLVEVFAYLTEVMIYRLNQVPDKAYVEFLNLLGVRLLPPSAATATLRFSLPKPAATPVEIPRGARVTVGRSSGQGEPPAFVTLDRAIIPAGESFVDALACHCVLVEGELAGKATGAAGITVQTAGGPIIAATEPGDQSLMVGVEALTTELNRGDPAIQFDGRPFRIWTEVDDFADATPESTFYIADRVSGAITFAPALRSQTAPGVLTETARAIAAVPATGREIRLWYRKGGGPQGNVVAGSLTTMKDPIPGVGVNNAQAAVGGRSVETLENALLRGPQELHSLRRAVTASDFELLAQRAGGVSRARAFTRAQLWTWAAPGSVEVVLIPSVSDPAAALRYATADIEALQTADSVAQVQSILEERRPLGTSCVVGWAKYKTVKVRARVVARPEEDKDAVRNRVLDRLYRTINPLPVGGGLGWDFGKPLDVYAVYHAVLSEPGVLNVEKPSLLVDEVPGQDIDCLAADAFQPNAWYAGTGEVLFRSTDDGEAWEPVLRFSGQMMYALAACPYRAGVLAVATRNADLSPGSRVFLSSDCGENWSPQATQFDIEDLAWVQRDRGPSLLMATSAGLYELSLATGAAPLQLFVHDGDNAVGYYSVAASTDRRGAVTIAAASKNSGGIFISTAGQPFRAIGLAGVDVRVLAMQEDGDRTFLWAGIAAPIIGDPGKGCQMRELLDGNDSAAAWQEFSQGWLGGSCTDIAFYHGKILASTYDGGVLWLNQAKTGESWNLPAVQSNLPLGDRAHTFQRVDALGQNDAGKLMAGCKSGIFLSTDEGATYSPCSKNSFSERVTVPPTWVFCSGAHEIEVVTPDEARKN